MARTKVGDAAPAYRIRLLGGGTVDGDSLVGQVVVINRWAVWCGPCKQELPAIDAYARAHAGEGLRVFAATIDDTAPPIRLKPLAAVLSFPLATEIRGGFPVLGGVPTNYVIDRRGVVRYARAEAFDTASLDAIVGPLLAEPPPR